MKEHAQFWKRLLESDVWVLGTQKDETELDLHTWEPEGVCALFTSRALLEKVMEPDTPWLQLNARIALGAMLEARVGAFINPRHESQIRLRPGEIAALLAGELQSVGGTDA